MTRPLRLGFAGTPAFAATILEHLLDTTEHRLELVLSQPDRPFGRGRKLQPSPVKALARRRQLPVETPESLKGQFFDASRLETLDLLIVAAYGLILPTRILNTPRLGCLNVHASLLPRWRGAAPVERAIMAGDSQTGVCLMQMDRGLDTGAVFASEALQIGPEETGGQLERRLAEAGARLLVATLPQLESLTPVPQPEHGVCYAHKIVAEDSEVDWRNSAADIARQVRALADRQPVTVFCPPAGAGAPVRLRILAAISGATDSAEPPGTIVESSATPESVDCLAVACGSGCLLIDRVQLNRGKGTPMSAAAAANGYPDLFRPGQTLFGRLADVQ